MLLVDNNGGLKYNIMKVALVCIAKNEDMYIQEWINYNKKLGFDDIIIYQNDWRCSIDEPNVITIDFDGVNKQREAYHHFIQNNYTKYDWAAFFDIDEFLVLKKHQNVKDFISDYLDYHSIGVNWVLFGDNGHQRVNNEYSVLKRFTKRQKSINNHVKSIIKLSSNIIMDVHNPFNKPSTDTNKRLFMGPFNENGDDDIAQLNHYFGKTKEEFTQKCNRGRADTPLLEHRRTMKDFEAHNFNEVEDLTAMNFLYDNDNILNS